MLVARGEAELHVLIEFNACMDCHEFFKSSSLMWAGESSCISPRWSTSLLTAVAHAMIGGAGKRGLHWQCNRRLREEDRSES